MPKGTPLPNMMDNEIVALFYSVIKHSSETDFGAVAKEFDLKDAGAAKARLHRMMKAQEKKGPAPKAIANGKAKAANGLIKAAGGEGKKAAGRPKKHNLEEEEVEPKKKPKEELKGEPESEKANGAEGGDDDEEV